MHTAKIKALTMPAADSDIPGTTELLAYFARVSSTANQFNHETGPKLIKSLVKRKEWSPLEMVDIVFEIETTRDVARQILRHRSFSFQEFSQRYAVASDEFSPREVRFQHPTDRQASVDIDLHNDEHVSLAVEWEAVQHDMWELAQDSYQWALSKGIAKEVARAVLPEGLTPSKLYMKGSLRSFIHYCELRCDLKTQKEHRLVACQIRDELVRQFPALTEILTGAEA